jgi:hypothetical protein
MIRMSVATRVAKPATDAASRHQFRSCVCRTCSRSFETSLRSFSSSGYSSGHEGEQRIGVPPKAFGVPGPLQLPLEKPPSLVPLGDKPLRPGPSAASFRSAAPASRSAAAAFARHRSASR